MRNFVLFQARTLKRSSPLRVLRRLVSNWRKRRRLRQLLKLDDHILKDIGLNRFDLIDVLNQPLSVDPAWELERRARLRRSQAMPAATRRWLRDRAFTHPRLDPRRSTGS